MPKSETPEEVAAEEAVAEPENPLAALEMETRVGFEKILGAFNSLNERLTEVEGRIGAPPPEPVAEVGAPAGVVRFYSPYKDYGIWQETTETVWIDNRPHVHHGRKLEFVNGVLDLYEKKDAKAIAFLREHPDFGRDFVEDPMAKAHSGPTVVEGAKGTHTGRAVEPPAELAARI